MPLFPPKNIQRRKVQEFIVPVATQIHRFYTKESGGVTFSPLYFDKGTGGRFNDSAHGFGVMYGSEKIEGAFAETFLRKKPGSSIRSELLEEKGYAVFTALRELKLARLFGTGLNAVGTTAEMVHTRPPYDASQAWAHELKEHKSGFDGIAYHSRHNSSEICYALFDHVEPDIEETLINLNIKVPWFFKLVRAHGATVYVKR
jgi:RES domain